MASDRIVALKDGSFRITVSAGYTNGKQRKVRERYYPKSTTPRAIEKEVKHFADELAIKVKSGRYDKEIEEEQRIRDAEKKKLTFKKYFYGEWKKFRPLMKCDDKTLDEYCVLVERWAIPHIGDKELNEIIGNDLTDIVLSMIEHGLKAGTIKRNMVAINSVFRVAYTNQLIVDNPYNRIKETLRQLNNKDKKEKQILSEEQTNRFLEYLHKPYTTNYKSFIRNNCTHHVPESVKPHSDTRTISTQIRCFLTLACMSGCRRGELIALTWADCEFDAEVPKIRINKSASTTKNGQIIKCPKTTSSVRVIDIPIFVADMLKQYRIEQEEYSKMIGNYWVGKRGNEYNDNFLFIQDNGLNMNSDTPLKALHKTIKRYNSECADSSMKLPLIGLHDLRHSHASDLVYHNENILDISKRLGHADVTTTLKIYTHAPKEDNPAIVNHLDKRFG